MSESLWESFKKDDTIIKPIIITIIVIFIFRVWADWYDTDNLFGAIFQNMIFFGIPIGGWWILSEVFTHRNDYPEPPYQPRESIKTILTDEKIDELARKYKESGERDKVWERVKKEQKDYFFDNPDAYEEWLKWGEMSEEEREANGLPDTYDKWLESYWDKKNSE